VKSVLQLDFNGSWEQGGCLSHITRVWARNARNYAQFFASSCGAGHRGTIEGRPHHGFDENRLANRIHNKILRRGRFCFFSLLPIIEELKPDILHFHNRHDLVDQIVAKLSYRPKVVCTYHVCYNKLVIPAASDLLLGVSKFVIGWLDRKAEPAQPMAVLHNPFWRVPLTPRQEKPGTHFFNYSNQPKATRDLFEAVKIVQAQGWKFSLRSVGHVYSDLAVPEGVTVSGFVPQPEFFAGFLESSAYICSSYNTTFSIAVLEAIAQRVPVICPWDIGALDLLPMDCVISYESHSIPSIAEALSRFLNMSPSEREAMAERALAAVQVYDESVITQKLERLYDTLFA